MNQNVSWSPGLDRRAPRLSRARRQISTRLLWLAVFSLVPLPGFAGQAQQASPSSTDLDKHHVILLIDASNSVLNSSMVSGFKDVLRNSLGPFLQNPQKNGFGIPLYRRGQDVLTVLTFGVPEENPLFDPESAQAEFLKPVWLQESNRDPAKLADLLPGNGTKWTGLTAALGLATDKIRHEIDKAGIPLDAFARTFLVMVTDGKENIATDRFDEISNIEKASDAWNSKQNLLRADAQKVRNLLARFSEYYSLRGGEESTLEGYPVGPHDTFKIIVRELSPHRLDGPNTLLMEQPDPETELGRTVGGTYQGRLKLRARAPDSGKSWTYEVLAVGFRGPGETDFSPVAAGPDGTFELGSVSLQKDDMATAEARFRLVAVRRDPVYGQSLQEFQEVIRFRPEPTKKIFGVVPVFDWMLDTLPGRSQEEVANFYAVIAVLLLLALLYYLIFPPPKAAMELLVPGTEGGAEAAIPVDFNLAGQHGRRGHPFVLRTLRFKNLASRLPRNKRAERKFHTAVEVRLDAPPSVELGARSAVGLSSTLEPSQDFPDLTHNSELTIGLLPQAVRDFTGDWRLPVDCSIIVQAAQHPRSLWGRLLQQRRDLPPQEVFFQLRFVPEEPKVEARLEPVRPNARPESSGAIVVEHMVLDPGDSPQPVCRLVCRTTAERACSLSRDVRVRMSLYRADGQGLVLERAAKLGSAPPDARFSVTEVAESGYWRVQGLDRSPAQLDVFLDFSEVPHPGPEGSDYILQVRLLPDADEKNREEAGSEGWLSDSSECKIHLVPDPRKAGLKLTVDVQDRKGGWLRKAYRPREKVLVVSAPLPVKWNIGRDKSLVQVIAQLDISNLAHQGDGNVELTLEPGIRVEGADSEQTVNEPSYQSGSISMVELVRDGQRYEAASLSEPLVWSIPNQRDQKGSRHNLKVRFQARGIASMPTRQFEYLCVLPFKCRTAQGGDEDAFDFEVRVRFKVERWAGNHVLSIDYGTSAVVTAFAESENLVDSRDRPRGFSEATLDLQRKYLDVLAKRKEEQDAKDDIESEKKIPNLETGFPFIPSQVVWRPGKQVGTPEFVFLPPTLERLMKEPQRAIYFVKGLLLRGDENVPDLGVKDKEQLRWQDELNEERSGSPPVDAVLRSVYRNLVSGYVRPLLNEDGAEAHLDRVVFAHPNAFSAGHCERLTRILREAFGDRLRFELLSESNAVAMYCAYQTGRFLPRAIRQSPVQHLLVYDIGAGTLDLTYTRLTWENEDPYRLKRVEVLFRYGVPIAGNHLDQALARVLDRKVRILAQRLEHEMVNLSYTGIVDPEDSNEEIYRARMIHVKLALHQAKKDLTEHAALHPDRDFTIQVPLSGSPSLSMGVLSVELRDAGEALRKMGITTDGRKEDLKIGIPLRAREVFSSPEVEQWLSKVTDDAIGNFAGALEKLGLEPKIDTLILSGRTSQFPPLEKRLLDAIEGKLGLSKSSINLPRLSPVESKDAVALGCLNFSLRGADVEFVDRNVWATYGIIYNTGLGLNFQEYFGYATSVDPRLGDEWTEIDGRPVPLFRRTHEIRKDGSTVELAMTFSHDPDADIRSPDWREKFVVIKTLGVDVIGRSSAVRIQLSVNAENQLRVVVNPDEFGIGNEIEGLAYLPDALLPQLEWPFKPLRNASPVEDEAPPKPEPGPEVADETTLKEADSRG